MVFAASIIWSEFKTGKFKYWLDEKVSQTAECIIPYSEQQDKVCVKALELAKLSKWILIKEWENIDKGYVDSKDVLERFMNKYSRRWNAMYDYTHTDIYKNIWDFAEKEQIWITKYNYTEWICYAILIILWYIILTDILRGAMHYIDSWKFPLLTLDILKKLIK